jgi:hypothetical protein
MLAVIILVIGLLPLVVGVYAWTVVRKDDERGSDDPPPPPEPERPQPIVPPSLCRSDRGPVGPPRAATRWRAPVRA